MTKKKIIELIEAGNDVEVKIKPVDLSRNIDKVRCSYFNKIYSKKKHRFSHSNECNADKRMIKTMLLFKKENSISIKKDHENSENSKNFEQYYENVEISNITKMFININKKIIFLLKNIQKKKNFKL